MFVINLKSRVPIYEQLKSKTLELVVAGVLIEGQQMPSVRSLARELGVNPNTIQKAYQEMEREGIIYSVTGKGSFVAADTMAQKIAKDKILEKIRQVCLQGKSVGISLEQVMKEVSQVYREEPSDD